MFSRYQMHFKDLLFQHRQLQDTVKEGKEAVALEKEKCSNLEKQNHALEKELEQKKEILNHIAREKRRSQKAFEEISQSVDAESLKLKIAALEEEVRQLKNPNQKMWNLFK